MVTKMAVHLYGFALNKYSLVKDSTCGTLGIQWLGKKPLFFVYRPDTISLWLGDSSLACKSQRKHLLKTILKPSTVEICKRIRSYLLSNGDFSDDAQSMKLCKFSRNWSSGIFNWTKMTSRYWMYMSYKQNTRKLTTRTHLARCINTSKCHTVERIRLAQLIISPLPWISSRQPQQRRNAIGELNRFLP